MFNPTWFFGTVVDRDDPLKLGRCRVRVDNIHPLDTTLVPDDSLPWAMPIQWIQSAATQGIGHAPVGPLPGTRVFGFFIDGSDSQIPVMMGTIGGNIGHLTFPSVTEESAPAKAETPTKEAEQIAPLGNLPTAENQKAVALAKRLKADLGLTDVQAAGIVGNFLVECPGLIPNLNQGGRKGLPASGTSSGKGYGWAQWDNVRRKAFVDFCAQRNLNVQTDEANYQYLLHEARTTERSAIAQLKTQTTISGATKTFTDKFERAGVPHYERRIEAATTIYKSLTGANVPVRVVGASESADGTKTEPENVPNDIPPSTPIGPEPIQQFRGVYPFNKSYRSESGHIIEIDDTPNEERLFDYHTSGTYTEINAQGRRVVKVVGENYTVIAQDDNLYVEGSVNIFVKGNMSAKVNGNLAADVGGDVSTRAAGAIRMQGAEVFIESLGEMNIKAGGNLYIDSPETDFADAAGAGISIAMNPDDLAFLIDDDETGVALKEAQDAGLIPTDLATVMEDEVPVEEATAEEKVEPEKISGDCGGLDQEEDPDPNTKISKYYRLASLTTLPPASRTALAAQKGLTKGQIACNLSLLAKNCLDKIKEKYPNMIVTSGFRAAPGKNPGSDHLLGKAVDIQFSGVSNEGYTEIAKWIRDYSGIPYDQMLLEHKDTQSKKSWIHISYRKEGNRQQTKTFFNHRPYRDGLVGRSAVV